MCQHLAGNQTTTLTEFTVTRVRTLPSCSNSDCLVCATQQLLLSSRRKCYSRSILWTANCNDCFRLGYRQTIKGYITGAHQVIWIPMSKKVEKAGRDQQQSSGVLWYGKVPATNAEMWYYAETAQCIRATLFKDFLLGQDVQPIIPGYICCDICQA